MDRELREGSPHLEGRLHDQRRAGIEGQIGGAAGVLQRIGGGGRGACPAVLERNFEPVNIYARTPKLFRFLDRR
ncbi:MAG: hypothetical protein O7D96_09360, partial [SAR324 cluster bacterium]|nr:hypothetical protein [SAR324 cluster bacterium]